MNEATNRMDLNTLAEAVDLSPNQTIEQIHQLAEEKFLRKVGSGYCLTEKGKNSLKITQDMGADKSFQFFIDLEKPLGFNAQSLDEFYRLIKQVCSDSVEFHFYRGDFEKWVSDVLLDSELSQTIGSLKTAELHGQELREAILEAIDAKYGIGELL